MKFAIISDIHANLEAFEAALRRIDEIKPDKILCLGDIVGYGPDPNECVKIAKNKVDFSLCGNHEYGALGRTDLQTFSENARIACEWTREVLSDENFSYIKDLPVSIVEEGMFLVHSTPINPERWDYIFTTRDASYQFMGFSELTCLVGHSHVPACFEEEAGVCKLSENNPLCLEEGRRYIINFGSIGQPRDYDPRASFGVIDTEERRVQLIRIAYDIERVQRKIMNHGLPLFLAERLGIGV
jgi:diadenosine tetraphosphatase ApaH/serine/threonine PP2A family protein phosphatase